MHYSLNYFDDALQDAKDAKAWYKEQQSGLDKQFANSIKSTILFVQRNPFAFAVRYRNIRVAFPKKFPYGIHFYIDEKNQQIIIIAITHNKRNPKLTTRRIG